MQNPTSTSAAPPPTPVQHVSEGMRSIYALLGVVALLFAVLLLVAPFVPGSIFPGLVLHVFVVAALLAMGISDIVSSQSPHEAPEGLRVLRLMLGVLIILFAFVALVNFSFALLAIWIFVGLGLLFQGMFLLVGVGGSPHLEGWQRSLGTGLGVIDVILAFLVILLPALALVLVYAFIAVAVIAAAVYLFTIASTGVKRPMPRLLNVPGFTSPPFGGAGPGSPPSPPA